MSAPELSVAKSAEAMVTVKEVTKKRKSGTNGAPQPTTTKKSRATAEMRRAQNRVHAATCRQRKVAALRCATAEVARLREQNEELEMALRDACAGLEFVLDCVGDLPAKCRDSVIASFRTFCESRNAAGSVLQGL